jgi:hypothetical protein
MPRTLTEPHEGKKRWRVNKAYSDSLASSMQPLFLQTLYLLNADHDRVL